jgi:hypothetical protein
MTAGLAEDGPAEVSTRVHEHEDDRILMMRHTSISFE